MPISVTGISTDRRLSRSRARNGGFSLLELLVVVVIIGIFVGVAVLSVDITGEDRQSEQEVFRLKTIIDLVREEALMQSRDFGLLFSEDAYRFYTYDYAQLEWLEPTDDRLLGAHQLADPLEFSLRVEDRDIVLATDLDPDRGETPQPQVMILSTGEVTPFTAEVYRDFNGGRFTLTTEFDGESEITSSGY